MSASRAAVHRPAWHAVSALVLVCALFGCSNSPNRAAAPTPSSTSIPAPVTAPHALPSAPTSTAPLGGDLPAAFDPVSVTFVSLTRGWILGSEPCPTSSCAAIFRTDDGGSTWRRVPAPSVRVVGDVQTIRFADANNGWLFGPNLWTTHDGGEHWSPTTLPGESAPARVGALEAANGSVHAAVFDGASTVQIETSVVDADAWTQSPTTIPIGAGPVPDAQIVLHGSSGWLVEVDRTVVGGARLVGDNWVPWDPPCLSVNGPMVLAAATSDDLAAICNEGVWGPPGPGPHTRLYLSSDGGATFREVETPVPLGCCIPAVTSPAPGSVVASGTADGGVAVLLATFDAGATWTPVLSTGDRGPWAEVGFTSSKQGVAVSRGSDGKLGELAMTFDGGHNWRRVTSP